MAHKESFEGGSGSMEGGECAKDHRRGGKTGGVHVETEQGIDAGQTSWRTLHGVVCWSQTVHVLVPRRGTREQDLGNNSDQVQVSETEAEYGDGGGRSVDKHDCGDDKGSSKVTQAIRKPGQQIKSGAFMGGQDIR